MKNSISPAHVGKAYNMNIQCGPGATSNFQNVAAVETPLAALYACAPFVYVCAQQKLSQKVHCNGFGLSLFHNKMRARVCG
jgi:hypothetical protein